MVEYMPSPVQDMLALLHEEWVTEEEKNYIKTWLHEVLITMKEQKDVMGKYR